MKTPYLETVANCLQAPLYPDRTGKGRHRQFGGVETYDLTGNVLPADTTNQMYLKTLVKEVFAFIKGSNQIKDLGEPFWRKWSPTEEDIDNFIEATIEEHKKLNDKNAVKFFESPENREAYKKTLVKHIDTIGPMYGVLWSEFPRVDVRKPLPWLKGFDDIPSDKVEKYKEMFLSDLIRSNQMEKNTKENFEIFCLGMFSQSYDQLAKVVAELKRNPFSSRHRVTAHHPDLVGPEEVAPLQNVLLGYGALSSCHSFFQFMVTKNEQDENVLNCMLYMSSSDVMLGRRYNVCQYSLLTIMLAHCLDFKPGKFTLISCDTHIYGNHIEDAEKQLLREPLPYPTIELPADRKDFFAFTPDDVSIVDYQHHPLIKYEVAV